MCNAVAEVFSSASFFAFFLLDVVKKDSLSETVSCHLEVFLGLWENIFFSAVVVGSSNALEVGATQHDNNTKLANGRTW